MSNGRVDETEVAAILSGNRRAIDTYIVTGIKQLTTSLAAMRANCEARGLVCPGLVGPGHETLLDAEDVDQRAAAIVEAARIAAEVTSETAAKTARLVKETATTAATEAARIVSEAAKTAAVTTVHTAEDAAQALADSKHTWAMWEVFSTALSRVGVPVLVVVLTLLITGKL